jgi:hypothetical protein
LLFLCSNVLAAKTALGFPRQAGGYKHFINTGHLSSLLLLVLKKHAGGEE